jgi:hypothetical protein
LSASVRRRLLTIGRVELAQIARNTLLKLRPTPLHFAAREVLVVQELAKSLRWEQCLPLVAEDQIIVVDPRGRSIALMIDRV